jgi:predicted HTH transcriptional regulator
MRAELESSLKRILRFREGGGRILKTRESTRVEFKQSFNFGSMPEYARTMIAFSNTEGGFIVFGVRNQPHEIIGVKHGEVRRG